MDYQSWYNKRVKMYSGIVKIAKEKIQQVLKSEAIEFPLIQGRVKSLQSFSKKIERKKYDKPEEMTDLAGVRVVCYVPSDVKVVSDLVEAKFNVDWEKSVDKYEELIKKGKMGYRGRNYIVTFREGSVSDKQYSRFKDVTFEIQVRTLLDFSGGEIQHDRNYKTAEELPKDSNIPRRYETLSASLETLDNEFDRLSKETQQYAKPIPVKIRKGNLDIPVSPLSLREFLTFNFSDIPGFRPYFVSVDNVLDELSSMGIKTIYDLNHILPKGFKRKYKSVSRSKDLVTFSAIIRDVLIIHNPIKYFMEAWKEHYNTFDYHCWKVYNKFNVDRTDFPPEEKLGFDEGSDDD